MAVWNYILFGLFIMFLVFTVWGIIGSFLEKEYFLGLTNSVLLLYLLLLIIREML